MKIGNCCERENCPFLDGNLQDGPDIDPEAVNTRVWIMNAVHVAFRGSGEQRQRASELVGAMSASDCKFIRETVSKYKRYELMYINGPRGIFSEVL